MTPPVDEAAIRKAVKILGSGGLVAIPTETVYGLAADADNRSAVEATFRVKGRPTNHPLIVHICGPEAIDAWAENVPPEARMLARAFWPGPLTMVLKKKPRCGFFVTGGQDTVALRCPSHPWAHALLKAFAGPSFRGLTAPSCNTFGRISPSRAEHVVEDLGVKPEGKLDFILDGGPCEFGIESTMINLSGGTPSILRHGVITREAIEAVLGTAVPDAGGDAPRASGRLKSHYAPKTKLEVLPRDHFLERAKELSSKGMRISVMAERLLLDALSAAGIPTVMAIEAPMHALEYGAALYENLHQLDHSAADRLLAQAVPDTADWAAVADRLGRASA